MTIDKVQLVGYYTILRREVIRVFRIWPQTLLPSVITTTLYFLIFGNFIGSRIGSFQNVPYIDFIVPGLIMMSIISNSYGNIVSSFYGSKFQKNIEEMLVAPLKEWVILLGFVSGGMARGLMVGFFVTLVSMFFTPLRFLDFYLIFGTMVLTSALFSLLGFVNAVYARSFDDISIIPTFILTPLIYLGGVFYSIKVLPVFWQKVSLLNPILYLVNIFRYGFLGISDINVSIALLSLSCLVLVMWFLCLRMLKRGVGLKA